MRTEGDVNVAFSDRTFCAVVMFEKQGHPATVDLH